MLPRSGGTDTGSERADSVSTKGAAAAREQLQALLLAQQATASPPRDPIVGAVNPFEQLACESPFESAKGPELLSDFQQTNSATSSTPCLS
mmetsp:Transcript_2752/g.8112  ORF Transcript_2752/g.8112 Transcript_2752/m.8112 type:complete len:91 (-) Transcript_2752:512-784(-)